MKAAESIVTGLVPSEVAATMSGLDFIAAMRDGTLVAPPFSATTDIRPTEVSPGRVVFEGTPSEQFYNPMGTVHGGWITTLLDTAMACAIQSMLPAGQTLTTLELKANFARPVFASTGTLRCEGVLLCFGGRIASAEGKIFDADQNLVAHGTETCLVMAHRNVVPPQA
ncbi:MAG: PaaI family thioesterase [Hyphomicrobium sp.]|uniref:PaaI family thioesterase n=1 Tax=Hyphomicrobium sp. TaxID=82 RepID=UPI0039E3E4DB